VQLSVFLTECTDDYNDGNDDGSSNNFWFMLHIMLYLISDKLHCYKANITRPNSLHYDGPNNILYALRMKSVSGITNEVLN
jgi:hypothetical protein